VNGGIVRKTSLLTASLIAAGLVASTGIGRTQGQKVLNIYYLDMEGGGGTLLVSPAGESLLIDAGNPGARDADRIAEAAKQAGLKQIDYLLITHYDADHVGGVPEVAARIPIRNFVDYGTPTTPRSQAPFKAYTEVREKGRHLQVKPGDKVPIAGLDVEVVSAGGMVLTGPLAGAGASNPLCADVATREGEQPEDQQSVGVIIRYGRFKEMQLGDLTWNKEHDLACPKNVVGTVDVYQTSAHGLSLSSPAALVHAIRPRVVVMNNGPKKGASRDAWMTVKASPGLEDLWQVHYSEMRPGSASMRETGEVGGKDLNVPEPFIANLNDTTANFLKLTAQQDGSFVVTNPRDGHSKAYQPR
jgi:competence protein ComEC